MNLNQLNRLLLQTLMLPVVVLLLVSGALIWQIGNARRTVNALQIADNNIATATLLTALVVDEETGLRGFQTTSNEIFLQPFLSASSQLPPNIDRLRQGIHAQGGDLQLLDEFAAAHQSWIQTVVNPTLDLIRADANTRDSGLNFRGKGAMDRIRRLLSRIADDQEHRRQAEVERWQSQVRHTLEGVVGVAALLGLVIGLFARSRLHIVTEAFQGAIVALRRNAQSTYESEQRLRTILTSIADGVIVCDHHCRIEMLNTVAEQLTQWSQPDAFHRPLHEIFHIVDENTHESIESCLNTVLRSRLPTPTPVHALLLRRDGTGIHIDHSGAPILDRSGALAGVVMVIRNVTEQRRTQTALLTSEKLAVSGRLAATLAHEIHNPLDAVVNLLYLMKTNASPDESAEFLDMARSELDRVSQISRAMLSMYRESKIPIVLNLKEVVESVLLLLRRQLVQSGITLRTDLDSGGVVMGYPAELRQVFTNIFTNAMDASSPGTVIEVVLRRTPALRSSTSTEPRPAGVTVAVIDHGAGMGLEALDQLFQPFFTTKGEKGTGLGLWISRGIVEKHGGEIRVDSRADDPDHGTTVTIFLPHGAAPLTPAQIADGLATVPAAQA